MILGFIYGLQYSKRGPSSCYESVELLLMTSDEFLMYLPFFYMPQKWANLGIAQKDIVDFAAAISTNCNTEVLVNSAMSLFSQ